MAQQQTIKVIGWREVQRDFRNADRDIKKKIRDRQKRIGEPVRREWASLVTRIDAYSASKLRIRSNQSGVFVDQPLRRTTGKRPDFARLQQRYGEAALARKENQVRGEFDDAMDELAEEMNGKGLSAL